MAATGRSDSVELNKCRRALALARIFTSESCQFLQFASARPSPTMGDGRCCREPHGAALFVLLSARHVLRNSSNREATCSVNASTL